MRILKSHPLLKLINSYLIDSSQPASISYLWNFGSLLAFCLVIQIVTGVTLAMHYNPSVLEAFNSVEHIMRDVNNGWLIRYLHSNTASAFFFIVYLHIGKGLYYASYKAPRTLVWTIGTVIFILMIVTGFLGYVLPYGQMSLWGATVITNLMSAIPWIGQDIVEFLWGGFSVNNATLNRFFALHFVLPFVLAALALMHLIALHDTAGSGNPIGVTGNVDRLPFAPYFLFKDLITIFIFIFILSLLVFFMPNLLGDSDNYVMANPMQTPPAIVPEWYLLPFYAILRSIPNKLLGVIAMLSAILILLAMPFADLGRSRGLQFRPLSKVSFYIFISNFFILMQLGAKHVESPFIELGQVCTVLYFAHFLIIVPLISIIENSLVELSNGQKYLNIINLTMFESNIFRSFFTTFYKTLTNKNALISIFIIISLCIIRVYIGGGFYPLTFSNFWTTFTTPISPMAMLELGLLAKIVKDLFKAIDILLAENNTLYMVGYGTTDNTTGTTDIGTEIRNKTGTKVINTGSGSNNTTDTNSVTTAGTTNTPHLTNDQIDDLTLEFTTLRSNISTLNSEELDRYQLIQNKFKDHSLYTKQILKTNYEPNNIHHDPLTVITRVGSNKIELRNLDISNSDSSSPADYWYESSDSAKEESSYSRVAKKPEVSKEKEITPPNEGKGKGKGKAKDQ